MHTQPMIRHRLRIGLLILAHLLALLMPAGSGSVAAQVGNCTDAHVQAANAADQVVTDQKVKIAKNVIDKAFFMTVWRHRYPDALVLRDFFVDAITMTDPGTEITEATYLEFIHRVESAFPSRELEYRNGHAYDDYVHTLFDVALGMPELAPVMPSVWSIMYSIAHHTRFPDSASLIAASVDRYSVADRMQELTYRLVAEAYDCAQVDPAFAAAFDRRHKATLIAGILDSADRLIAQNPDLPFLAQFGDRIDADGTLTLALDDLNALTAAEFAKLHTTIDDMQATLVEIDKQQDVIVDYLQDQELKQKAQALAKKKAEEYQLKLDAAKASISILATLTGQFDPNLGKQLAVVGNATVQVGDSINKWLKAASGLNGLNKVASFSTVVMTGNVLGAVMNVVGLFRTSGPAPDQMILEEIGRLRQQIDQMRVEMHDRFDRVDQELNTIYTTMHSRFDQIDIQLGKINGNILEIQQSLLNLDLKLSRIERNNFEFLNALGRRPLLEAINGGLGYAARTGSPMPYQPDFVGFENVLHSWSTIHAYDAVNAGPIQRNYSDGQVLAELNAYPLDSNLNYLNGWLVTHGLAPLANKRLPSPRDWLFAGRAYTALALEWPDHMGRIDPERQAMLHEIGVELETAMRNIAVVTPALAGTAAPQGNSLLFTTVMTHYQTKLGALDSSLQALEAAFVDEVRGLRLQRSAPFDLFGGAAQAVSYVTPELTTATCGDPAGHGSYAAPANLRGLIPHFDRYNLADYLRLDSLAVCISDAWINPLEYCESDPERPNDPPICEFRAHHKAILTVTFDGLPIMRQTIDEGEQVMPRDRANNWTRDNWTSLYDYKGQFAALTAADTPSPDAAAQQAELLQTTTTWLETALSDYQRELYGRVVEAMTKGALAPLAIETAGSKALLDSFVTLGLPRATREDEFLHALLFGDQRLVADGQIVQTYALSSTQPMTGTALRVNPRLVLAQVATQRSAIFTEIVLSYLDAITAQSHVEAPDYIVNARRAFDLTMRMMQVETPPTPPTTPTPLPPLPGDAQKVQLPLIYR